MNKELGKAGRKKDKISVRISDIAWAAGFLEGDGHFGYHKQGKFKRKDGSFGKKYGQPVVVADQVNPEPLIKLASLFGGAFLGPYKTTRQPKYRWEMSSNKAAALMMTMWSFMSKVKQDQIEVALARWKLTPSAGGDRRKSKEKRES